MTLNDLSLMFNRALSRAFGVRKFLCLFLILIFAGLIFLFFQGISLYVTDWLKLPLKCIPLFIVIGFVMAGGALVNKIYLTERQGENESIQETFVSSWELILRASYYALPLLLAFIVFWVFLGLFIFLKAIPLIGTFFGIVLAFAPFLLNLATLLLFLAALGMFFFLSPLLGLDKGVKMRSLLSRIKGDIFTSLLLLAVALLPVWIVWLFVGKAAWLTYEIYSFGDTPVATLLQTFFMMLPFMAILTPALTYFFNFAAEAHLFMTPQEDDTPGEESA